LQVLLIDGKFIAQENLICNGNMGI